MESCGLKFLKWLMFIFNFLFFIFGCALLALGIWVIVDGASLRNFIGINNDYIYNAVYLFIAVGVALIIISFFGFCGAIKENQCMLGAFFLIVLVIFIIEVVAAVLAFVYYPQVERAVVGSMSYYENTTIDADRVITEAWDLLQSTVRCCGFNRSQNWVRFGPFEKLVNGTLAKVPVSCCADRSMLKACLELEGNYFENGCESKIQSYFWVIGGVGIAVLVVELFAMIFACCLFKAAGKEDNYS